ncbi:flagellar brake protein [Thiohalobacter thiocyanaticus]|uniref:Cyclic di-GMP binding protein YcgR n=1 Tax=Thiohalobacter thiocyanaticus TaxID=585455 RepID=A0A426QGU3_9GAMM|nr:flagellar brake protein [Thiohalobacter thiocyanaticus]RRQ20950.1 hypothetical protein D6C00_02505 [Thiohalobacter thiocyanaticus]
MADAIEQQEHYRSQSEKITHPPQVIALLRRLHENRILLRVRIPGVERSFNSLLLNLNPQRGYLLLDELNDEHAHRKALETGRLRVFGQHDGVEMNFNLSIRPARNRQGVGFYQAGLPDCIHYMQRRADYRVHVAMDMGLSVLLPLGEETLLDGQLCDVSMGGLGARLETGQEIRKGLIIPDCRIQLPEDPQSLQADLEVRFALPDEQHQVLRMGGRFCKLSSSDRSRLRKFVTQLEREMIRRRSRGSD